MADAPKTMLWLDNRSATSPTPTEERTLRLLLRRTHSMTTPHLMGHYQVTHTSATGPVSERWLEKPLFPRVSRRPYHTHRYFQQRMTSDGATKNLFTLPAIGPCPKPHQASEPVPQVSVCWNSSIAHDEEAPTKDASTTLRDARKRPIDLVSENLETPLLKVAQVALQATHVPQTSFESLSPGSTIEDTEEDYKAGVKLCLGSYHSSSAKTRNDITPCGHPYETPSKRIQPISVVCKSSEELKTVNPTDVKIGMQGQATFVRPHERPLRKDWSSVSCNRDQHSSHAVTLPGSLLEVASSEVDNGKDEQHEARNIAGSRLSHFAPDSIGSAISTLVGPPISPSFMSEDAVEREIRSMNSDQSLEKMFSSRCIDIKLSQVVKSKGAFLGPRQLWCHVPSSWEDAVILHDECREK